MNPTDSNNPVSEAASDRVVFPCTPTQERSWFLNQLRREDSSFSIPVLWEIKGTFDAAAIEEAFQIIVQRHEILRTRFVEIDGEPMQEVLDEAMFNLSIIDVSILNAATRQQRAWAICERESKAAFDLNSPPLLRATLIRFHETHAQLLIVAHPSVFDGWSIGILGRELGEIIAALRARRPHRLPELKLQYGDYALWHREYVSKGGLEGNARYWQTQLRNAPYFEIAPDHPAPEQRSQSSGVLTRTLETDLGERLEASGKANGVSFFVFGAAIIAAMLRGYTGQTDVVIGTQVAGRNDIDLEPLIGAFVNNLVLRFAANTKLPFSQFVKDVADTVRDALVHQHMPFDQLVRLLNPRRDVSRMPLYSINVILQPAFMEDAHYGDFSLTSAPAPYVGTLTDLNFHMIKRPSGWRMTLEYNSDRFERATVERIFRQWLAAMKLAVSNADALLSEFAEPSRETSAPEVRTLHPYPNATTPESVQGADDPVAAPVEQPAAVKQREALLPRGGKHADPGEIEQRLIGIWREILRTQDVNRDSNFFELGGHSLSAMRMIARASALLGPKVDPATFFKAPTIRDFALRIGEFKNLDVRPWRIVPIQPNGSNPALVAINGATVYYNFYKTLSVKLGVDQPLFSVQPFDPRVPTDLGNRSMADIATEYLELVRKVSPSGPYVLMGHCVFGVIALWVAQQLLKEGKTVRAVVLFDTWAPGYIKSRPFHQRFVVRLKSRIQVHRNRIGRILRGEITIREATGSLHFVRALYRYLTKVPASGPARGLSGDDWFLSHTVRARENYQLSDYDGSVISFVSDDCPRGRYCDPDLGWRTRVKGRLSTRRVGGAHMTMGYGVRAALIAEHIRSFLDGKD